MIIKFNKTVKHDYPKKIQDTHLAWYRNGKICIIRKYNDYTLQMQNLYIKEMNQIIHRLWSELSMSSKRDLQKYANQYKKRYPSLRKRGNNAYSIFLMICHSIIRKFSLNSLSYLKLEQTISDILSLSSIHSLILQGIISCKECAYQLNQTIIKKEISNQNITILVNHSETIIQKPTYIVSTFNPYALIEGRGG